MKKSYKDFIYSSKLYLWVISFLVLIIFFYDYRIALTGVIILVYLVYHESMIMNRKKEDIEKYLKTLSFDMDQATKDTLLHFPLPMVIITRGGTLKWFNQSFSEIFGGRLLFEKNIEDIVENVNFKNYLNDNQINQFIIPVEYNDRFYEVAGNYVSVDEDSDYSFIVLYWINKTDVKKLEEKYELEKNVVAIIMLDNYEEVLQNTEDAHRSQVVAEVDRILTHWAGLTKGIIKKYERDKYICIFSRKYLEQIKEKKYEILNNVKEINKGNSIPITLSIGLGYNGDDYITNEMHAKAAIDIALGRGGDQIVTNNGKNIKYYGGNTQEYEKRTRVKARVIAFALREIITQSKKVVIMGHVNPDIDCIGASIGLSRIIKNFKKECYILLDNNNFLAEGLLKRVKENKEYKDIFIDKGIASNFVDNSTLVIVVDTHKPTFTIMPKLLDNAGQVVVIDHHRRGAEFINNAVLSYHEPYASSTCEMITEIIQYVDKSLVLNTIEAESLYTGIVVDTKNFTFKTGVRTFEAAAYLRRIGVNIAVVKKIFQDDRETYFDKIELIKSSEIYKDEIAIAHGKFDSENVQLLTAQTADELLNIKGISSSFVLCESNNNTIISARSLGHINVQVILEQLGGGGHLNVAGAQLVKISKEKALENLKEVIDRYLEEEQKNDSKSEE